MREGDRAPDFTLESQDGRAVTLSEYKGRKLVVLYFYPKDFTAGCTAEARTFSLQYEEVKGLGAEVVGISSDSTASHGNFADECNVAFPLLSDEGGKVRRAYGVRTYLGLIPGRVTFVIDREGIVRRVYSSQLNPKRHVEESIATLRSLQDEPGPRAEV